MSPERLKELRALAEAATPGPWHIDGPNADDVVAEVSSLTVVPRTNGMLCAPRYDAAFIAASRSAVPELLDEVERLRESLRNIAEISDDHSEIEECLCRGLGCSAQTRIARAALGEP